MDTVFFYPKNHWKNQCHSQELAHLHPELRSTYGLVQKHQPQPVEEKEEEEEEEEKEEADDRVDSFKAAGSKKGTV